MWQALGGTFGMAMALALSPLTITTALVLLFGDRGRLRGLSFAVGWWIAIFIITLVPMLVTDVVDEEDPAATSSGIDILHLVFGLLFFVLAAVTWAKRPERHREVALVQGGEDATAEFESDRAVLEREMLDLEPKKPGLLERVDHLGVWACLAVGLAQGFLIIKNIPIGISAGTTLGQADVPAAEQFILVAVFASLATAGAVLPLLASILGGARAERVLLEVRHWIEANMTAITLVVLIVVGGIFLGEGLGLVG